jgi:FkbM family methyltransferase
MFDKLRDLKSKGYSPDTILDIGAFRGYWTSTMRTIYNDPKYYLFEAIDYPELQHVPNARVFNVVLSDKVEEVNWYQMANTGGSMFREKSHHFTNCAVLRRQTIDLDALIRQEGILHDSKHIFIKIDCQGAEIPILKGASSILDKTDFIVMEMPLFGQYNEGVPTFLEHIQFMDSIGFVPYDIADTHIINGFNMQVDMLFIHKKHPFNKTVNELLLV